MKPSIDQKDDTYILYDNEYAGKVIDDWFEPAYWESQQAIEGVANGRGTTLFVQQHDAHWVLRHYRRGGLVSKLSEDRYLWTGLEQTRAWCEWSLLSDMREQALPVPRPIAARVCKRGLFYTADLLTERIPAARSLSQYLTSQKLDALQWCQVGKVIKRFHQAGIYHADLNAHNIMLNDKDEVFLIDFDRGEQRPVDSWPETNLQRLRRSLDKLKRGLKGFSFEEADWQDLMQGYHLQQG